MSQINVDAIRHTSASSDAITLASDGKCAVTGSTITSDIGNFTNLPNRNLIINGACNVAQRASSGTGTGYKSLDRWNSYASTGSWGWTQSKDTDSPDGFSNSFKIDVTTAHTPGAAEYCTLHQRIEAQDLQHLLNGSAGAKKVTLSFWVKSPKTGNHAVALYKPDNTARVQTKTYSVSAANTWEKKTITYDGDTGGGGIANDNGVGLQIDFVLAVGSDYTSTDSTSWVNYSDAAWAYGHAVNCMDNTANNFYLTGVQLETGEYATDFEHRSYGDELARCQRYYQAWSAKHDIHMMAARGESTDKCYVGVPLCVPIRAEPTVACASHRFYRSTTTTWSGSTTAPTIVGWTDACTRSPVISILASGHSASNNEAGCWSPEGENLLSFDSEL